MTLVTVVKVIVMLTNPIFSKHYQHMGTNISLWTISHWLCPLLHQHNAEVLNSQHLVC